MKVLVLGASGLLGSAIFRTLFASKSFDVIGTSRSETTKSLFPALAAKKIITCGDLEDLDTLNSLLEQTDPDVVINCTSLANPSSCEPARMIALYALLPKRLSHLCKISGIRFIQISSDGVFSGTRGNYCENDIPDAQDPYGVAKLLGEASGHHALTIRTSMIGHSLTGKGGLLEWFLSRTGECKCFRRAIFSGLPTIVIANIIRDQILCGKKISGIYHIASAPISKYELLSLVAERYKKDIKLIGDDEVVIDRSLNAQRFLKATQYAMPTWPELIDIMYKDYSKLENAANV